MLLESRITLLLVFLLAHISISSAELETKHSTDLTLVVYQLPKLHPEPALNIHHVISSLTQFEFLSKDPFQAAAKTDPIAKIVNHPTTVATLIYKSSKQQQQSLEKHLPELTAHSQLANLYDVSKALKFGIPDDIELLALYDSESTNLYLYGSALVQQIFSALIERSLNNYNNPVYSVQKLQLFSVKNSTGNQNKPVNKFTEQEKHHHLTVYNYISNEPNNHLAHVTENHHFSCEIETNIKNSNHYAGNNKDLNFTSNILELSFKNKDITVDVTNTILTKNGESKFIYLGVSKHNESTYILQFHNSIQTLHSYKKLKELKIEAIPTLPPSENTKKSIVIRLKDKEAELLEQSVSSIKNNTEEKIDLTNVYAKNLPLIESILYTPQNNTLRIETTQHVANTILKSHATMEVKQVLATYKLYKIKQKPDQVVTAEIIQKQSPIGIFSQKESEGKSAKNNEYTFGSDTINTAEITLRQERIRSIQNGVMAFADLRYQAENILFENSTISILGTLDKTIIPLYHADDYCYYLEFSPKFTH